MHLELAARAARIGTAVTAGVIAVVLATAQAPVAAKVAGFPLDDLVKHSEFIGLVAVDRVRGIPFLRAPRATARVLEQWKGVPTDRVRYVAAPDWACDISGAEPGEVAVVFLDEGRLAHSGRGRMAVFTRDGRRLAEVWPEVRLPAAMTREPGQQGTHDFRGAVSIEDLRAAVRGVGDGERAVPSGGASIHRHATTAIAP